MPYVVKLKNRLYGKKLKHVLRTCFNGRLPPDWAKLTRIICRNNIQLNKVMDSFYPKVD